MVSWSSDGLMSGYSPTSHKLIDTQYHFASGGTVDVNAITRLNWALNSSYSSTTYPNRLLLQAPITFTSADQASNANKWMTVSTFLLSSQYVTGTPTPSQILANPNTSVIRGDWAVKGGPGQTTVTHTIKSLLGVGTAGVQAGSKIWVLLLPVIVSNWNSTPSVANDKPIPGTTVNGIGRALSFWTNRTPNKPVITSPSTGSVFNSGDTITLTYDPNDPDAVSAPDSQQSNQDLAGVQVQIAQLPTPDNPSPTWSDLEWVFRKPGADPSNSDLIKNLGMPITAGGAGGAFSRQLPGGDWQIRVRTADWGHPYPNLVSPYGAKASTTWTFDTAPSTNISPWSDPVKVSVPVQVPPPVPTSPVFNVAVEEDTTVRLSWQYRNTHNPPFSQMRRWVQIRKVGDPAWSTIFAGASSAAYVDLPPVLANPTPIPDAEYCSNPSFESAGIDGWDWLGAGGVSNSTVRARTGTHSLLSSSAANPIKVMPISAGHDTFTFSGWFYPSQFLTSDPNYVASVVQSLIWLDGSGSPVTGYAHDNLDVVTVQPAGGWGDAWLPIALSGTVPPGATQVAVQVSAVVSGTLAQALWMDDVSLIGHASTNLDSFTLEATTHYEWRVQVMDTDGVISSYSQSAFFWVVDAPATNDVRPVPANTIEGATLGCGTHRVFVYRRGGQTRVGEIGKISHVDWSRVRDDISTSKIVVSGWDVDCGNLLAKLQTWAYEIVIFRDNGYSVDRVWEGPITLLTYEKDKVTIQAKDVMGYAYRRILKQAMNDIADGKVVTARAAQVLQNAFAPDDPNVLGYMQVLAKSDDAKVYRSTPAYSRTAFEEVDDMAANAGLDYTAVGRAILLWDTSHRIGTLPEFTDEDLGAPPIVSEYGMSMANRYVVSDGNGLWGEATRLDADGNDTTYGLVEMLSSTWASDSTADTGTYTQAGIETMIASFASAAERSISDRYPPPVVVRVPDNTTLNPSATISIQQLVPGVGIPLRSVGTLRKVFALQKLDSITVTEESGNETITITMSPFNSDETLASEETDG